MGLYDEITMEIKDTSIQVFIDNHKDPVTSSSSSYRYSQVGNPSSPSTQSYGGYGDLLQVLVATLLLGFKVSFLSLRTLSYPGVSPLADPVRLSSPIAKAQVWHNIVLKGLRCEISTSSSNFQEVQESGGFSKTKGKEKALESYAKNISFIFFHQD
ncbi:hypothetical protein V6N11_061193 [Hibiscus sabdariffa]|uniref:Uncharacterized protein n=1 Tax=Hibiscus sabdariffa TaxID=183260 RepID=A0ABR2NV02_9ROSI